LTLYNSITVDSCDVCITLAECPGLAQEVKSFSFTYPRLIADDQSPKVNLGNLTLALKNMINLNAKADSFASALLVRPSALLC
jgi:hypothetical protein